MTNDFATELSRALDAKCDLRALIDLIVLFRDTHGLTQVQAEQALSRMLPATDEQRDDLIRDVLDFVTGFCSPHARLW